MPAFLLCSPVFAGWPFRVMSPSLLAGTPHDVLAGAFAPPVASDAEDSRGQRDRQTWTALPRHPTYPPLFPSPGRIKDDVPAQAMPTHVDLPPLPPSVTTPTAPRWAGNRPSLESRV